MSTAVLLAVAVAAGFLAGCSNGKDRQVAMKKRFSTLDSNFIAEIAEANSNEQVSIAADQERFSNSIMSLHLTLTPYNLTNLEIAQNELTNAVSKETAKLLLLMSIRQQQCELQRAEARNTMLLEKLRWFYTNSMPIAEESPSNDLEGIAITLSDSLSKSRNDEIVTAGLHRLTQLLAEATNAPRTDEETARQKKQEQLEQQQLSIEKWSFAQVETNIVPTNWTFTTLQGRTYSNVIVESSDPISVRFRFSVGGESRVLLTNLLPADRAIFHYDKTKADGFIDEQAANAARSAIDARIRREFIDEKTRILATKHLIYADILQIVKDGVLVIQRGVSGSEPWMLWHYPSAGLVDGKRLANVEAYSFGTYQYETVNHSSKTILRLTTNLTNALQEVFYEKHPGWPLQAKDGMTAEQIQELQREQKLEAQLRGIDYFPTP